MNPVLNLTPYSYDQLPARIKMLNDLANDNLVWELFYRHWIPSRIRLHCGVLSARLPLLKELDST